MQAEQYEERRIEIDGWPVKLTRYRLGDKFVCQADNVSPGAVLARISAETAEEAQQQAVLKARHMLARTQRRKI